MREKGKTLVSWLFYIVNFAKISLSLSLLAGQEYNLRTATSGYFCCPISLFEHSPYVVEKVKNFLGPFRAIFVFLLNSKKAMKNPDIRGQIQYQKGKFRLKRRMFFSII